jgi:hypothetical protein
MFVLFLILLAIATVGTGVVYLPASPVRKAIVAKAEHKRVAALPQGKVRSWPAQQILRKNHQLPVEHRVDDLERIVDALDVKYIIEEVNDHFNYWDGYRTVHRWDHRCYGRCSLGKYAEIYDGLQEINDAIATQKHMVKVAAVQDDLKRVDDVISRIKQEKGFIVDTTKAITTGF